MNAQQESKGSCELNYNVRIVHLYSGPYCILQVLRKSNKWDMSLTPQRISFGIGRVSFEHTAVKLDPRILPVDDGDDLVGRPDVHIPISFGLILTYVNCRRR